MELINNKGKGNRAEWGGVGETVLRSWRIEVEIVGLNFINSKLSEARLSYDIYFEYKKTYLSKKKNH